MACSREYHGVVRSFSPVSFALAAFLAAPLLVCSSRAQINGAPASVTSPGFGGHAINGVAPSVTSVGPRGYAPGGRASFSVAPDRGSNDFHQRGDGHNNNHSDHRSDGGYIVPYLYAVPYTTDLSGDSGYTSQDGQDYDEQEYRGGPTIFDRRGSGAASYVPPVRNIQPPSAQSAVDPAPDEPQEPTVLVFKDGHTAQVGNYAIVGATLFDLSPGHHQKVALADLDLDATEKQNDERGVNFRLPASSQAN